MANINFQLRITAELKTTLEKEAQDRGISTQDLCREKLAAQPSQSQSVLGDEFTEGSMWQVQVLGARKVLVQKRELQGEDWKRRLAERKDKRYQEMHEIDLKLKDKKLTGTWKEVKGKPAGHYACQVGGCGITVEFATYETLQSHYEEYHPERFVQTDRGVPAGKWWNR